MGNRFTTLLLATCLFSAVTSGVYAAEAAGKGFPLRASATTPGPVAQAVSTTPTTPAPSPVPAAGPTTTQAFENQPVLFSSGERRQSRGNGYSMPSIWPAVVAVLVVCGIFGGILYVMKKYIPGHKQLFSHPSMEILGRTHLDQKRYISLLRVGKRILVVGVSPDDMQPLSEIVEEDEITSIMEVARPKTENGLTIFQRLFQRTVIEADVAETKAIAEEEARQLHEDMTALRKRVQGTVRREQPETRHVDRVG